MHLFTYLYESYTFSLLYGIHLASSSNPSNTYLNTHQLPTTKSQAETTSSQLTILTVIIQPNVSLNIVNCFHSDFKDSVYKMCV